MSLFQRFRNGIQQAVYYIIDPAVRGMVRLGATPNMMTTVGLLGNLAAAALIFWAACIAAPEAFQASSCCSHCSLQMSASPFTLLGWAGALMLLFSIFDMVDGYMARTAHMESRFGAFYDSVLDRYCELAVLCGLAFYFMLTGSLGFALWTFLAIIGSIMVSYIRARAEALGADCKVGLMQRPERVVVTSLGLLLTGLLQDAVCFDPIWLIAVPIILIAVLANGTAIARIMHVKRGLSENSNRHEP